MFLKHLFLLVIKTTKKRRKILIETFQDWALAYTTWASTIIAASPSRDLELLQYLGVIARLARDNPPHVWLHYDKQFRQMAAAAPQSTKWDELQFQFLQWAKQSQPAPSLREPCRRWNEGRYCQFSSCKRDHSCSFVVALIGLLLAHRQEQPHILLLVELGLLALEPLLHPCPPQLTFAKE